MPSKYLRRALPGVFLYVLSSCSIDENAANQSYLAAAREYATGNFGQALRLTETALKQSPHHTASSLLAGKINFFDGEYEAARAHFADCLERIPRAGEAALWLARLYRFDGQPDKALESCGLVLASDPSDIAALRLAAALAREASDDGTAMLLLDRAAEASAEAGLVFLDRAALLWERGDDERARRDVELASSLLPETSAVRQVADRLGRRMADAGTGRAPVAYGTAETGGYEDDKAGDDGAAISGIGTDPSGVDSDE